MKFLWFGPWVSRIDWCEGHWNVSTYMVVRLSDKQPKNTKKTFFVCFWAYVGQPHNHISWATYFLSNKHFRGKHGLNSDEHTVYQTIELANMYVFTLTHSFLVKKLKLPGTWPLVKLHNAVKQETPTDTKPQLGLNLHQRWLIPQLKILWLAILLFACFYF